jgi:uncharacterized protein
MFKNSLEFIRRHPLIGFTVLAYLSSWLLWRISASSFVIWLGGFGPACAAFILTALCEGQEGLRRLLAQIFIWKVNPVWYIVAFGLPVFGTLALILLYALGGDTVARLQILPDWLSGLWHNSGILGITLLFGVFVIAGEEFGWRGFILPRLQMRYSDLHASLIVGLTWGLWHLPTLWPFQPEREMMGFFFFMADIIVISIIYTWLYNNSRGSLLMICMFHSAYDVMVMYASATIPFLRATRGYELLVLLLMAGAILLWNGPKNFIRAKSNMAEANV